MSGPMLTIVRDPDWLLNALWVASSSRSFRCSANLPPTFLVSEGKINRGLRTDDKGHIARIPLEGIEMDRDIDDNGFRGESFVAIRIMRRHLIEFYATYSNAAAGTPLKRRSSKSILSPPSSSSSSPRLISSSASNRPFTSADGGIDDNDNNRTQEDDTSTAASEYSSIISVVPNEDICTVTYVDGSREDLPLRTLDILLRNEGWINQVLIIQGYIPCQRVENGLFITEPKTDDIPDPAKQKISPPDELTLRLAKFAEKAYNRGNNSRKNAFVAGSFGGGATRRSMVIKEGMNEASDIDTDIDLAVSNAVKCFQNSVTNTTRRSILGGDTKSSFATGGGSTRSSFAGGASSRNSFVGGTSFSENETKLKVHELKISCAIDRFGKRYLQQCSFVSLNIEKSRREMEAKIEAERRAREMGGAYAVARELLQLMQHGLRRGVSARDSFAHFDVNGNGFVDAENLIEGLSKIGIGVTYPVAAALLQCIGTVGAKFVTEEDFEKFINMSPDQLQLSIDNSVDNISPGRQSRRSQAGTSRSSIRSNDLKSSWKSNPKLPKVSLFGEDGKIAVDPSQNYRLEEDKSVYRKGGIPSSKVDTPSKSSTNNTPNQSPNKSSNNGKTKRGSRVIENIRKTVKVEEENKRAQLAADGSKVPPSIFDSTSSTLVGVYKEMRKNLSHARDELLHVHMGVVMTYRLLSPQTYKDSEATDKGNNAPSDETKGEGDDTNNVENAENSSQYPSSENKEDKGSPSSKSLPKVEVEQRGFTLVVVPDLFMTLEALQLEFKPIFNKYPSARVVCVGLPGMPNTIWPKGWALNADLHARSIAKLLQYLDDKKTLSITPDDPIFLMGIGSGVHCLSRFITLFLHELPSLEYRVRNVTLVNGMLKFDSSYQQILKDLYQSFPRADALEVHDLVTSLHFSDDYIAAHGDKATKRFWGLRRELCNDAVSIERAGLGYVGILEQIRGLLFSLDNFDGSMMLLNPIPVVVVQSVDDVFVNPRHAVLYQPSQLPPEREVIDNVKDCLKDYSIMVCWLKGGHEVLQERTSFLLGLVSNYAMLCGINPIESTSSSGGGKALGTSNGKGKKGLGEENSNAFASSPLKLFMTMSSEDSSVNVEGTNETYGHGGFDIIATVMRQKKEYEDKVKAMEEAAKKALEDRKLAKIARQKAREEKRLKMIADLEIELQQRQAEEEERLRLEELQAEEEEKERLSKIEKLKADDDETKRSNQKALEKAKRDALREEQQRRIDMKAQRQKEIAEAKEIARLQAERRCELRERINMEKEYDRTVAAWEYAIEMEIKLEAERAAKQRALEQSKAYRLEQERKIAAAVEAERVERELARRSVCEKMQADILSNKKFMLKSVENVTNEYRSKMIDDESRSLTPVPPPPDEEPKKEETDQFTPRDASIIDASSYVPQLLAQDAEKVSSDSPLMDRMRKFFSLATGNGITTPTRSSPLISGRNSPLLDAASERISTFLEKTSRSTSPILGAASEKLTNLRQTASPILSAAMDAAGRAASPILKRVAEEATNFVASSPLLTSIADTAAPIVAKAAPLVSSIIRSRPNSPTLPGPLDFQSIEETDKKDGNDAQTLSTPPANTDSLAVPDEGKGVRKKGAKDEFAHLDDSNKVMAIIAQTFEALEELWGCRCRSVESILRHQNLSTKLHRHNKMKESTEIEANRLRRAIKLIQNNPAIIGVGMEGSKGADGEIADMQKSLNKKEAILKKLTHDSAITRQLVESAQACADLNFAAIEPYDQLVQEQIKKCLTMSAHMDKKVRDLKMTKEELSANKEMLRFLEKDCHRRMKVLSDEINRIKDHKNEIVDTQLYVEGVIQRCLTEELRAHLHRDLNRQKAELAKIVRKIEECNIEIFKYIDLIAIAKRDETKMEIAVKAINKNYTRFSKANAYEVAKALQDQVVESEKNNERFNKDRIMMRRAMTLGATTPMDLLRMKDLDMRTPDEKRFIGLDIVMNPEAYLHLSAMQIEQMRFDQDYHCDLNKGDLQRIWNLPEQINLALPFLHTREEVEAHRLMNLFMRGVEDKMFADKDYESDPLNDPDLNSATGSNSSTVSTVAVSVALSGSDAANNAAKTAVLPSSTKSLATNRETLHDTLMKEENRDRIRCLGPSDDFTEEEQAWMTLDFILSPHAFDHEKHMTIINSFLKHKKWRCPFTRSQLLQIWSGQEITQPVVLTPFSTPRVVSSSTSPFVTSRKSPGTSPTGSPSGSPLVLAGRKTLMPGTNPGRPVSPSPLIAGGGGGRKSISPPTTRSNTPPPGGRKSPIPNAPSRLSPTSSPGMGKVAGGRKTLHVGPISEAGLKQYEEMLRGSAHIASPYTSEDVAFAKKLMDKYYVGDHESTLGFARLTALENTSQTIYTALTKLDQDLTEELVGRQKDIEEKGAYVPMAGSDTVDDNGGIKRFWGSWEVIHPASGGAASQRVYFSRSIFNCARDHPASFAIHEEVEESDDEDDQTALSTLDIPVGSALQQLGLQALRSLPGTTFDEYQRGDQKPPKPMSKPAYYIAKSLQELAVQDPRKVRGKVPLVLMKEPHILFEIKDAKLLGRQSRSHRFEIPDRDELRVLDMTVSIIFQGNFNERGYSLGRLAAGLFRLPDPKDKNASFVPTPIGYSPYSMQSPNLPDSIGRLVIVHRPKHQPLRPGRLQLVIGAASDTRYSVYVACTYAKNALAVVDEEVIRAKEIQNKMPRLLRELDLCEESTRLAEKKMRLCERIIITAEQESQRALKGLRETSSKLQIDNEEMTLLEQERKELEAENKRFEKDYAKWQLLFTSRMRERMDTEEGLKDVTEKFNAKTTEIENLKKSLYTARRDLPACLAVLRSLTEANYIAASLNTTVQNEKIVSGTGNDEAGGEAKVQLSTPAEMVRLRMKRDGFKSLLLEEQQWSMLDRALYPAKYEWLREQEDKDAMDRKAMGKPPKKKRLSAAVEKFRYTKAEVEHILVAPYSMLTRHEMVVRKLLSKFHDDPEILKKKLATETYGFDPHLAERTRSKNLRSFTQEEKEWASIDRILHPEVWEFYGATAAIVHNKDPDAEEATVGGIVKDEFLLPASAKRGSADSSAQSEGGSHASHDKRKNHEEVKVDERKLKMASALGKILNQTAEEGEIGLDAGGIAEAMRKKAQIREKLRGVWICNWPKDRILQVWRTQRHKLKDAEEIKVYSLLNKYNGTYSTYAAAEEVSRLRRAAAVKDGSHIHWGVGGLNLTLDMDLRARQILREIDRAKANKTKYMDTKVLQGNDQRFPTKQLLEHLERQLDAVLMEQIRDRERADLFAVDSDVSESEDDFSDEDGELMGEKKKKAARQQLKEEEMQRKAAKERGAAAPDTEGLDGTSGDKPKEKRKKKMTGAQLAEANILTSLGVGGCLACRSNPCKWIPIVDEEICQKRKKELDAEIRRVRADTESPSIVSEVALSAQLGGNNLFQRLDLLEELTNELIEINRQLQMAKVDMELHHAFSSLDEFVVCEGLHGYPLKLWTNNARLALNGRHNRLVAEIVAREVADDILDWMLEGWYFGERESQYNVLGYVPSIKPGGRINAGQDQIRAVNASNAKMKRRQDAKKAGIILDEARRGTLDEKALPVEAESQFRIEANQIIKQGHDQEHLLRETETTMKFGLFMMTLMYFRAMALVQREKKSWADEDDDDGSSNKKGPRKKTMTDERLRMLDEESKAIARQKRVKFHMDRARRGEEFKKRRADLLRQERIKMRNLEIKNKILIADSTLTIQRVYRGYIGRRNAKRWALKRAELDAMNALLNQTAIIIQRNYRAYLARVLTDKTRMELSQFIAYVRLQEATADEEEFWKTHPWTRFKRDEAEWRKKAFMNKSAYQTLGGAGGNRAGEEKKPEEPEFDLAGDLSDASEDENENDEAEQADEDDDEEDDKGEDGAQRAKAKGDMASLDSGADGGEGQSTTLGSLEDESTEEGMRKKKGGLLSFLSNMRGGKKKGGGGAQDARVKMKWGESSNALLMDPPSK